MLTSRDASSGHRVLARYIRECPDALADEVSRAMGAHGVVWRKRTGGGDGDPRWTNVDFLRPGGKASEAWPAFWPPAAPAVVWDAVGRVQMGAVGWAWLLVTAFGRLDELEPTEDESGVHAVWPSAAMLRAQERYHAEPGADWTAARNDITSRLAVLHHLRGNSICAYLLFVHVHSAAGGAYPSVDAWHGAISEIAARLGLTGRSALERRVFHAFLPDLASANT